MISSNPDKKAAEIDMQWTPGQLTDYGGSAGRPVQHREQEAQWLHCSPSKGPGHNGHPESGEGRREDLGTGTNIQSHGKPWGDVSLLSF